MGRLINLLICLSLYFSLISCSGVREQQGSDEKALYKNMYSLLTKSGQFSELVDFATPVFYRYKDDTLSDIAADACVYIAQSYVYMDRYDSVAHYVGCLDKFRSLKSGDIRWNYMVNNVSALWSIKMYGDYDNAMSFYLESLHDVDSAGEKRLESVVLSNIVSLYRALSNPEGLPYAERAYKVGQETGEDYYMCIGAYCLATMLYYHGDFQEAREYAAEAIDIAEDNDMDYMLAESNLICGDICVRLFDYPEAEGYYGNVMRYSDDEVQSLYIKACLSYGRMYNQRRQYDTALHYLETGLGRSETTGEKECCADMLREMSVAYSHLGVQDSAAFYYERYRQMEHSEKFIADEQEFDIVVMQYYTEEIDKRNAKLEKARVNNIILGIVALSVCVVAVCIYCFYRYRMRMYSVLVQQYNRFTSGSGAAEVKEEDSGSEKEMELWGRIEELMRGEKLYRHKDVSLTKISELLSTNRTYVSRVINRYSGLSFYDYINQYRIKDAVGILSDADSDIPLKALSDDLGFNSNSVFYRAFVKETGVPPSYFRENAQKRRKQANAQ